MMTVSGEKRKVAVIGGGITGLAAAFYLQKEAKEKGIKPIYSKEDVEKALSLWKSVKYGETVEVNENFKAVFKDAGHILGSSMIEFVYTPPAGGGRLSIFTTI